MCTVRWWAVLAFGAALSAGARGGETTGDPTPGTESPDPCTHAKLSEKDAADKVEFEGPEEDALKKTSNLCAITDDKTFADVREAAIIPSDDEGVMYGFFQSQTITPLESEYGPVKKAIKRLNDMGKCPECGKNTLYTFEGYPGYPVKKGDWEGKTFVEMAYWAEYRENANTAINPEARIAWEIHYQFVLAHENGHKKDHQEYLKAFNKATEKYSGKVVIAEVCAKNAMSAAEKAHVLIRNDIQKKYNILITEVEAAEKAFNEASENLDKKDAGEVEKLVPGTIPLVATTPQIDPILLAAKRWEEDFDASGQVTARTGFSYYNNRPSFTTKWSLEGDDLPTWITIDEKTGKITVKPKLEDITKYKTDSAVEATVKVEQNHTGYPYQPSMAAERKIAFTIKSWIPVIAAEISTELAPDKVGECRYTVQAGTGVPEAKKPTWKWSRTTRDISITTPRATGEETYVLNSSAKRKIYVLDSTGRKTLTVKLKQTVNNVAFEAKESRYKFSEKAG